MTTKIDHIASDFATWELIGLLARKSLLKFEAGFPGKNCGFH